MADKGGRVGGLIWFILGLLIGVAGTLGTQRVVQSAGQDTRAVDLSSAPAPSDAAPAPVAAKPKQLAHEDAASAAPRHRSAASEQSDSDIADDAAAAGMTSRTPYKASSAD
jgi:hypothetical protein